LLPRKHNLEPSGAIIFILRLYNYSPKALDSDISIRGLLNMLKFPWKNILNISRIGIAGWSSANEEAIDLHTKLAIEGWSAMAFEISLKNL